MRRFIGACFGLALAVLGLNAAIADGLVSPPGVGLFFGSSITGGGAVQGLTITSSSSAAALFVATTSSGVGLNSNTSSGSNAAVVLTGNATVSPLVLVAQAAPSRVNNKGDAYVDSTLNSLMVSNGTIFRRVPVGFGPTAMTGGVLAVTVETGTVGCIGSDTATGIACTCACVTTTCTVTCTAGGTATAAGFYY